MRGYQLQKCQLRMITYKRLETDKEIIEIRDTMFNIDNYDDKVELKTDVQKVAKKVVKTFENEVDNR